MTFDVHQLDLFVLVGAATGFQDLGLLTLSDPDALKTRPGPYLFQLAAQLLFAPVLGVISPAPRGAAYKAFVKSDGLARLRRAPRRSW